MSKKTFVDKVIQVPYKLGDIYTTKTNTFYIITGIEYNAVAKALIKVTRLGKNLRSQGNIKSYWATHFEQEYKPITEGQKLLFLTEEITDV